jgi:dipeptidyl-peptidase 4
MSRAYSLAFGLLISPFALSQGDSLKTVAEETGWQKTSKYADVVSFCEQLAKASPVVRLSEMGVSHEGRKLPLVILADPPVADADAAKRSGKLIVFVLANIHAGEVDGKEAILAFARDVAAAGERPLLEHLVFAIAPIFNADGNERFGDHRPEQAGPPLVGTRANAQSLDLNRDFVKLETPEVRALVRTLTQWEPAVFIDLHTTNGSFHRYTLTFEGGGSPAGDARLVAFTRDRLLPTVSKRMESRAGYKSTFYGNFAAGRTRWETVPPTPRYGFHYAGLRNCVSILSESYSYAPFPERVAASKAFVREIAHFTDEHRKTIHEMLAAARAEAVRDPAPTDAIVLRHKESPLAEPKAILGFVEETKEDKRRPTQTRTPKEYPITYMGGATPTLSVRRPFAYLFPPLPRLVENLGRHGVQVEKLTEPFEASLDVYRVEKITRGRLFQGHQATTVDAVVRQERKQLPTGSIIVRTTQPLGRLAAYLLEPQSSDGLVQWNFFDGEINESKDFPVVRLVEPQELKSIAAPAK